MIAAATVSNPGNKQLLGSLRRAAKPPEMRKHFASTVQNILVQEADNINVKRGHSSTRKCDS